MVQRRGGRGAEVFLDSLQVVEENPPDGASARAPQSCGAPILDDFNVWGDPFMRRADHLLCGWARRATAVTTLLALLVPLLAMPAMAQETAVFTGTIFDP